MDAKKFKIEDMIEVPKELVRKRTKAEASAQILRGLISYHERMTMGMYPARDFYLDALRYALEVLEKEGKNQS